MNFLKRMDEIWVLGAVNPRKRPVEIALLEKRRFIYLLMTNVALVGYLLMAGAQAYFAQNGAWGIVNLMVLPVIAGWVTFLHTENELRLLKLVEHLRSSIHSSAESPSNEIDNLFRSEGTT